MQLRLVIELHQRKSATHADGEGVEAGDKEKDVLSQDPTVKRSFGGPSPGKKKKAFHGSVREKPPRGQKKWGAIDRSIWPGGGKGRLDQILKRWGSKKSSWTKKKPERAPTR